MKLRSFLAIIGLTLASTSHALAAAPAAPAQGGGMLQLLVTFALIFLIVYFLMIRPQQKKQKEHRNLLNNLSKGDEVSTTGGIYGTVKSVTESSVELEVAKDVVMKFQKQAIAHVLPKGSI